MLACPGSGRPSWLVLSPENTTPIGCAVEAATICPTAPSVSTVDSVLKLKVSITFVAGMPRAPAIARCAPARRQMPFKVVFAMAAQVGCAALNDA